jgi:Ca2+-binding RTX toxin-like protein
MRDFNGTADKIINGGPAPVVPADAHSPPLAPQTNLWSGHIGGPVVFAWNAYQGTSGNDRIIESDVIQYGVLYGHEGNDELATGLVSYGEAFGGAGDDIVRTANTATGNASLHGGDGSDFVATNTDVTGAVFGGKGNDSVACSWYLFGYADGGAGSDHVSGGGQLYGGTGDDSGVIEVPLFFNSVGAPEYHILNAGLYGSQIGDVLFGGKGNDYLSGFQGTDVLVGGAGKDELYGGIGSDLFRWDAAKDSPGKLDKCDVIYDFDTSDSLDLAAIDANTTVAGNQAFTPIGSGGFTATPGELRYTLGLYGFLEGDTNGDAKADFAVALIGAPIIFEWQLIA